MLRFRKEASILQASLSCTVSADVAEQKGRRPERGVTASERQRTKERASQAGSCFQSVQGEIIGEARATLSCEEEQRRLTLSSP